MKVFPEMRKNVALYIIMAWNGFCYISEVSGLIHVRHYPLLGLSDCLFFVIRNVFIHVKDNGILVKNAYSFFKEYFFNTAQKNIF